MSAKRTKRVNLSCGHFIEYDSFIPSPGDEITCFVCNSPAMVDSVDGRQLAVSCAECNKIIAKVSLRATLTASVISSKHNVQRHHHATVITIGDLDEQPCLLPNPVQPDVH